MRIATYDDNRIGLVTDGESVVDITDLLQRFNPLSPADLLPDLISHFDELRSALEQRAATGGGRPVSAVRLHSPLIRPSKIVCLIGNYREGTDRPLQILDIFFKSPEMITGDGDTVILPPHDATIFHHEAELAVVINSETKNVSQDEAMERVFGYTVYNDVSERGTGREGIASFLGKSNDTFAAFGPWIVTRDEISDEALYDLHITVEVGGELRQDYSTADIERPVAELIAYISSVMTLHPGDVICCGTNHQGLGAMQHGDAVTTAIDRIGGFTLHVEDPQRRTWERGIDAAMAQRVRQMAQPAPSQGGAS